MVARSPRRRRRRCSAIRASSRRTSAARPKTKPPRAARMLEIRGLRVAYGGIAAGKGIDVERAARELVCRIGANGAGKTTTLKAIAGALPFAGGRVLLEGRDTAGLPPYRL